MNTSKKLASFVLGAGFSHALAKQKLTNDFSSQLREKSKFFFEEFNSADFNPDLKDFIINFRDPKWGTWNFETLADALRHIGSLDGYGYKGLPPSDHLEKYLQLIYQELFKEYLEFSLDRDLSNKYINLLKYLLEKDYEIHIFDLNFDLVLEAILVNSELRKEFNDFFPDSTYPYPSKDELLKKTYYSKPFNKSLLNKINLYKLHGAFNIFHHGTNTRTKPYNGTYYDYPAGFRKLRMTPEHYQIFLNEPIFEAIEKINPTAMEMSDSLWIGNTYKVSMIGMGQTYPSFCHAKFREILPESDSVFIIGYGTKDHDINSVLRSRSKLYGDYFLDETKEGIITSVLSSVTELNCKIDKPINFDCYLNQCLAQKL
ncbi:MAG: hypothetical protein ACKO3R_09830 [bacterium]